mgnify:CR=1 FL=1
MSRISLTKNELGNQYVDDKGIVWQIIEGKGMARFEHDEPYRIYQIATLNGLTKTYCREDGAFITREMKPGQMFQPVFHYVLSGGMLVKPNVTTNNSMFIRDVTGGWFKSAFTSTAKAFIEIQKAITNKQTTAYFTSFHAKELKVYLESVSNNVIELSHDNEVCSNVTIRININYELMSEADLCELIRAMKV